MDGSVANSTSTVGVNDAVFSNVLAGVFCWSQVGTAVTSATVTRSSFTNSRVGVASEVDGAGGTADCTVGESLFHNVAVPLSQRGTGAVTNTQGNNLNRNGGANSGTITSVGSM
jgi:hypothetical protein